MEIKKQVKWKNCLGEYFDTYEEAVADNKSLYMVAKAHIPQKVEFYEDVAKKHKNRKTSRRIQWIYIGKLAIKKRRLKFIVSSLYY